MKPALQVAPGVYDENLWEGLDFLLAEMGKRNMKAVMVLSNFWSWSGGFSQYLKWAEHGEIPYPQMKEHDWWEYGNYTKDFLTNDKCLLWYRNHVKRVLTRRNSITGEFYKDDPTIMAWQLANEPRGYDDLEAFSKWIQQTSDLIKSMDGNHLVSLGSEGNTPFAKEGLRADIDNAYKNIDYITLHIWVQNWNWYTPGQGKSAYDAMVKKVDRYWNDHVAIAKKMNKPLVLEEYGMARDDFSYEVEASVEERNRYYWYIYNKFVSNVESEGAVQGVNFWSYAGEGRPLQPGEYWSLGDDFIGDPPHELQGWYGVYDSDVSTLEVVKENMTKVK
ncbi:glycoside hydrolase 5 family protein [Saccharicrinis fermentans]|uniref:mannan endo-1,4-beta-mannosidase n=2 Tax=Saccharicrinis fermentans TaxID=982 RepID=W7Y0I5_9BACT|nr:cellulase family glycosylhydrolase [Saccharicrinis fermentans]GAF01467.1 endo-beta-mannanase [Saccharicrinis fermentans DSM 9555 = JCM 21142]